MINITNKTYEYLIVGSGLFGATCARILTDKGYSCLVIDKRNHIGGNCYDENIDNIMVHKYGAHIFHTNNLDIWNFVNRFSQFNNFTLRTKVKFKNTYYSFPVNLMTFNQMNGSYNNNEVDESNFETYLVGKIGYRMYNTLFKGYTEKQWNRECNELSSDIAKRIPIRDTFNDNYFNDKYQGIPLNGYTKLISNMLKDIEVKLNTSFEISDLSKFKNIIYTGEVDRLFKYKYGKLEYRSLIFEEQKLSIKSFQGNAVINYSEKDIPYTRIIEHKYFENSNNENKTIITKEYPTDYSGSNEPYYPINNELNNSIYKRYNSLIKFDYKNIHIGGRLGLYKYLNMDSTIEEAFKLCNKI